MPWDKYTIGALAIAAVSVVISLTLSPWLMGRSFRKQGVSPHFLWRGLACFLMGTSPFHVLLVLGAMVDYGNKSIPCIIVLVGLWVLCLAKLPLAKLSALSWLTPVTILCILLYVVALSVNEARHIRPRLANYGARNLTVIGDALRRYEQEQGQFPDDLRQLVDKDNPIQKVLIPPFSKDWGKRVRQLPTTLPYTGPCELGYNRLPANAPTGLVWVWEEPESIDYDQPAVLYAGGKVVRVTPELLRQGLARTQEWMKSHPYPTTATAPASCPATGLEKER